MTSIDDSYLLIKVIDTGPGVMLSANPTKSVGIGLKNTDDRLKAFYGDNYELCLNTNDDGGFCATIRLPSDI